MSQMPPPLHSPAGPAAANGSPTDIKRRIEADATRILENRPRTAWLFLIQFGMTALLMLAYVALRPLWAMWPRLEEVLFERGPWQYVTMFLGFLVVTDLTTKIVLGRLARFDPSKVKWPPRGELQPEQLGQIADNLNEYHRSWPPARFLTWTRRLALGLVQYARGDSKDSLRDSMQIHAQGDEAALASRYTMVKLYLWAIPLVGFIGTVEGIGAGIGEFSANLAAQSQTSTADGTEEKPVNDRMDSVRASLQNVTGGLGRAFDTTYLALVLVIALMIAMAVIEKRESERQLRFDEFCQTEFVGRLPDNQPAPRAAAGAGSLDAATDELVTAIVETEGLATRIETLRDQLQGAFGNGGINCRITLGDKTTAPTDSANWQ